MLDVVVLEGFRQWLKHQESLCFHNDNQRGVITSIRHKLEKLMEMQDKKEDLQEELEKYSKKRSEVWKELKAGMDVDEDHRWRATKARELATIEDYIADLEEYITELEVELGKEVE